MADFRIRRCCAVASVMIGLSAAGCTSTQQAGGGDKTAAGLVLGSVAGGLIGSQIGGGVAGTLIGAAAGGAIGAAVGAALDEQDRQEMARLTQLSFETGQAQEYTSARTGARVKVKIVKTTRVAKKICRTAAQDVELADGTRSNDNVTACKGANGWEV